MARGHLSKFKIAHSKVNWERHIPSLVAVGGLLIMSKYLLSAFYLLRERERKERERERDCTLSVQPRPTVRFQFFHGSVAFRTEKLGRPTIVHEVYLYLEIWMQ